MSTRFVMCFAHFFFNPNHTTPRESMVILRNLVVARPCVPPSLPTSDASCVRLLHVFSHCPLPYVWSCRALSFFFLFPVEFDFRRFLFRLADARDFVSCVGVVKEWESCLQGALMDMTLAPHQSGSAAWCLHVVRCVRCPRVSLGHTPLSLLRAATNAKSHFGSSLLR